MADQKVLDALDRIEGVAQLYGDGLFIGHSGGKDSQVILHLTKQIVPDIRIIHNVKPLLQDEMDAVDALTAMHIETLKFLYSKVCRENKVLFMKATDMPQFIIDNNLKCQVDGARISEADRMGKSSEIIRDGKNVNRKNMTAFEPNGIFDLAICYPIYDWTDEDVFQYLLDNDINFSLEYVLNGELTKHLMRHR